MNREQIAEALRQNQVVAYPTEAVFGLGCNPQSEKCGKKNYLILKQTPSGKKGLIFSRHRALDFFRPFVDFEQINDEQLSRLQGKYERPTTWIVPVKSTTPHFLTGKFDSIAVRFVRSPVCESLV